MAGLAEKAAWGKNLKGGSGFGLIVWGRSRNLALSRRCVAASVYLFVNQECAFPFRELRLLGRLLKFVAGLSPQLDTIALNT